jgi:TfoX/Sxy family transcriptional regulator of competence genes
MPFNEKTATRIREALSGTKGVEEKKIFGGIAFMVNDKMCIGVDKDDIIIRCDPEMHEELLSKNGARPFGLTGRPMKGWLLVGPEGTASQKDFDWWIRAAIEGNKKTPKSKKKK